MNVTGVRANLFPRYNKTNTSFRGSDDNPFRAAAAHRHDIQSEQQVLAALGKTGISVRKPAPIPELYTDAEGLKCDKSTGKPYTGVYSILPKDEKHPKITFQYEDGKLTRLTKFELENKELYLTTDDINTLYVFSYPEDTVIPKIINSYKFNERAGCHILWEKITMTPDITARYHIGDRSSHESILSIRDAKTGKKISDTVFNNQIPAEKGSSHPEVKKELVYLDEPREVIERFEYHEDGASVKQRTAYQSNYQKHIATFDMDKHVTMDNFYDKKNEYSSLIFYDIYGVPFEMNYQGITNCPTTIYTNNLQPMTYKLQVLFLTNNSSNSLKYYDTYGKSKDFVSAGIVERAYLTFRPVDPLSNDDYTHYRIQNWFWDRGTGRLINNMHPAAIEEFKIDPSETAFRLFNYGGSYHCDTPAERFKDFYRAYEKHVNLRTQINIEEGDYTARFVRMNRTGKLSYTTSTNRDKSEEKQAEIASLMTRLVDFFDDNSLYVRKDFDL